MDNKDFVDTLRHYGSTGCDIVGYGTDTSIIGSAGSIKIKKTRMGYNMALNDSDDHGSVGVPDNIRPDLNSQESVDTEMANFVNYHDLEKRRNDVFKDIDYKKTGKCNSSYVTNTCASGKLVIGFHVDGEKEFVDSVPFTYIFEDDSITNRRDGVILIEDENDKTFGFVRNNDGDVVPVTVGLTNDVLNKSGRTVCSFAHYVKENDIKTSDERFAGWIKKNNTMYDRASRIVKCFDGFDPEDDNGFIESYNSGVGDGGIKFKDELCLDNDNILNVLMSASMIMGYELKVQQRWSGGKYSHDDIRITPLGTNTPGVIFYGNAKADLDGLNFGNYNMEDHELMKFLRTVKSEFDRMYNDGLIEVVNKEGNPVETTEQSACVA
jgi:hypothetical protein